MKSLAASVPNSPSHPPLPTRRHLRVGIIQGKRIVEERVLRAPRAVTIGGAPTDTFITPPDDAVAGSWRLFEERRGRLVLRLAPGMSARVAVGTELSTLEGPSPSEGPRILILGERARGKIAFGDTTLLFQLVRPPTPQPRPQLPVAVRRHVVAELDATFTTLATLSFLLHLTMVIYLRQVDWPRRPALDELPDRFVQMVRRPTPMAPARPVVANAPSPKTQVPRPKPTRAPAAPRPAMSAAERHLALEKQVQRLGLLAVIGTRDGRPSAMPDLLKTGNPDQSIEAAFTGLAGVTLAEEGSLRNLPRAGDGSGRVATPTSLRDTTRIAEASDVRPAAERGVRSVVHEGAPEVQEGKVDAAAIEREIRARRRAIAACYERALKQQPTLAGKLVVRFSLSAAGTVTSVDIDDDSLGAPAVAECIRAVVLRWRFPALTDGAAELSFPFVFQPGG